MRFFPFASPSHKLRALAQGQNDPFICHPEALAEGSPEGILRHFVPQNDKKRRLRMKKNMLRMTPLYVTLRL